MSAKYRVFQSFETLGHEGEEFADTIEQAEAIKARQIMEIADMVSEMDTPDEAPTKQRGFVHESDAWKRAGQIAGMQYDDDGQYVAGPTKYGKDGGRFIAELAVKIETI
jgi:hypothetical protein